MAFWNRLFKGNDRFTKDRSSWGRGLLIFAHTSEVIQAEKLIKAGGYSIRVMGPPPEIRTGCDLVIEFPLIQELVILRLLRSSGIQPQKSLPVTDHLLQPVDLFAIKDFGAYLMVRAANMKLTVDKENRVVVNVSGGGCPDVPYLAREMLGRSLEEAPQPLDIGHTLCGYALHLAYSEMKKQCSQ